MPSRPKKRRSEGQAYETVPIVKQVQFTAPKRTIKDRAPSWSAASKFQQTITQMNPFFEMYYPDADNENLEDYDEEQESYVASPVGRKRRRITPEEAPARRIQTRSARRQAIKTEHRSEEEDREKQPKLPQRTVVTQPSKPRPPPVLMPPPKTPRSRRRKEIPSSQSPADTPLSTQSRRSVRAYSQSPLKEKSTNVMLPPSSQRKDSRWTKKLEVADSMETVEDDCPVLSRISSRISLLPSLNTGLEDVEDTGEALPDSSNVPATKLLQAKEIPESSQQQHPDDRQSSQDQMAREILDSDEEDEDEDGEFDAGQGSQITLASIDLSLPNSNQRHAFGLFPSDLIEFEPETIDSQMSAPSRSAAESTAEDQSEVGNSGITKASNSNDLEASDPITPSLSHEQQSESEGASAQLHNDLRHVTQAGGLETESQFEGAWNYYYPADTTNLASDPSDLLSSLEYINPTTSTPMTVPTQLLPPRQTINSTPLKFPVPPSQATTVDIMQSSPRRIPSSSRGLPLQRKIRSSSRVFPSSPPPMSPTTSSPSTTRKAADPWAGFEWNGVRLTDSQLLPESLMDDSQMGPPLTQESLDEEL